MGIVYKARQRRLDRMVALKLLEQEAPFAERFLREARALAKLNHPNIVTVFDFGESHGHYYLLMEFVDGVNLRQAMAGEQLTADEALRIVPVVCGALQYAHEQGVLHRDIKPANILLNREGEVKMADFGLAKFVDDTNPAEALTRTEASLGTSAYMAPEQTTDPSSVDHRADIYSLGVVFYEMLTGDLPLGRFPAPSSKASVDQSIDNVVMRTIEREPEERYQSAKDVRADVEHLSSARPPLPDAPRDSQKSLVKRGVAGSVLVFISLVASIGPIGYVFYVRLHQDVGHLASSAFPLVYSCLLTLLFGSAGTWLGWSAASRLRENPTQLWGLPFASFAALTWPGSSRLVPPCGQRRFLQQGL